MKLVLDLEGVQKAWIRKSKGLTRLGFGKRHGSLGTEWGGLKWYRTDGWVVLL